MAALPPQTLGEGDGVKIERCRAVLTLMLGKIGLMDLLDGCTKQHWQWNRVKGPIVPPRARFALTVENQVPLGHLWNHETNFQST